MFCIATNNTEDVTFSIVAGLSGDTYGYTSGSYGSISPSPSYLSKTLPLQIIIVTYDVSQTRLEVGVSGVWSVSHQDVMRFDVLVNEVYVGTLTATAPGQTKAANNSIAVNPFPTVGATYRVDLINFRPHLVP